jgi:hypothetical protein
MMDEDMILGDDEMDALLPTMAAVEPADLVPGQRGIGAPSVQLGGCAAGRWPPSRRDTPDPALAYFEWSINEHATSARRTARSTTTWPPTSRC